MKAHLDGDGCLLPAQTLQLSPGGIATQRTLHVRGGVCVRKCMCMCQYACMARLRANSSCEAAGTSFLTHTYILNRRCHAKMLLHLP